MNDDAPSRSLEKFIVRFPVGMRDRIAVAAETAGRSMNAEIVYRLEKSFEIEEDLSTLKGEIDKLRETTRENTNKLLKVPFDELRESVNKMIAEREAERNLIRGLSTGILSVAEARAQGLSETHNEAFFKAQETLENAAKQLVNFGKPKEPLQKQSRGKKGSAK